MVADMYCFIDFFLKMTSTYGTTSYNYCHFDYKFKGLEIVMETGAKLDGKCACLLAWLLHNSAEAWMEGWGRKWIRNEERSLCTCASMIQRPFPPGFLFLTEWGDPLNVRCMAVWAQSRAVPSSWEDNWRWARRRIPGEPEELDRRLRSECVQLTQGLWGFSFGRIL